MQTPRANTFLRIVVELLVLGCAILIIVAYFNSKTSKEVSNFEQVKSKYNDSLVYFKDKLGREIATKEVAVIERNNLQYLDSTKYAELTTRYERRIRQVLGSTTARVEHDTVKVPFYISEDFEYGNLGLIEYSDSCLYAGLNFTDSGAYMNYLIAATEISGTMLQKDGKIVNEVALLTPCGKVGQVKTFIFAPEPKKWFQKPLVVGGIGLGAGIIAGIIIAK